MQTAPLNRDRMFLFGYGYSTDVDEVMQNPEQSDESNGDEIVAAWVESNRKMLADPMSFDESNRTYGMARVYEYAWDLPTMAEGEFRSFRVQGTDGEQITAYVSRMIVMDVVG